MRKHRYLIVRERSWRNVQNESYRTTYDVTGRYYTLDAAVTERIHMAAGNYWIITAKNEIGISALYQNSFEADFVNAHFETKMGCLSLRAEPACDDGKLCHRCPARMGCAEWIG